MKIQYRVRDMPDLRLTAEPGEWDEWQDYDGPFFCCPPELEIELRLLGVDGKVLPTETYDVSD